MTNAEEKLMQWQALYREWSDLSHWLHERGAQEGGPAVAEMKARSRLQQQQCASALAELDSAVVAMRQHRKRRADIA